MVKDTPQTSLTRFIVRLGLVSLFADFTYEGSHALLGLFLAKLAAGPLLAGLVAGSGELLASVGRLLSGRYADRTQRYWPLMMAGYGVNVVAIPTLALVTSLPPAVFLILLERVGKGLRGPARNALIAKAADTLGAGRAFGLHASLDQAGGFLGPLTVAALLALSGFRLAFAFLLVPAALSLILLHKARAHAPAARPHPAAALSLAFPALYFRYMAFAALSVMGLTHFILFSYHLAIAHRMPLAWVPILYALAMASAGLAARPAGHLFDRVGLKALYALPCLLLVANPLLFLAQSTLWIVVGTLIWGMALGVQGAVLRAAVSRLIPAPRRGSAYGLFDAGIGLAWLLGSLAMGALYGLAPHDLVLFTSITEILALGLLTLILRRSSSTPWNTA